MVSEIKKYPERFVLLAAAFFIIVFVFENINHRFWLNDYKVYYSAARAFLSGEPIYGVPFGLSTGFYKYSPFVVLLFMPDNLFPYPIAAVIHYFILAAAAIACVLIVNKILGTFFFRKGIERENPVSVIAFLCVAVHLVREVHLGNVNLVILLLLVFSLLLTLDGKNYLPGTLLAVSVLFKPYFLLVLIPVVVFRKWKVVFAFFSALVASEIICAIAFGFQRHLSLYNEWFNSVSAHGSYLSSSNTIQSLLENYVALKAEGLSLIIIVTVSLLLAVLLQVSRTASLNDSSRLDRIFIAGFFSSIAIIPNLVITDTQHFLLSLPLIVLLLCYLFAKKSQLLWMAFIFVMLFFGLNSTDLLGKTLVSEFDSLGLPGISNLLLIASSLYLCLKEDKTILKTQG